MKAVACGRFVFPADSGPARAYLAENLLPIHGRIARLRATLFGARATGEEIELDALPFLPQTGDWVLVRDYELQPRLVFTFRDGALQNVTKVRRRGDGALAREAGILSALRPPDAPRVEDYTLGSTHEILKLSAVRGRPLDISMQRSFRPRTRHRNHLLAAARWLGNFHRQTGATHGDFWARNVLFTDANVTGVVDWEHAAIDGGDRWHDVFLLPFAPYVDAYLREYSGASGVPLPSLRERFAARKRTR
jgi:aminoglycoside phosphotransferase